MVSASVDIPESSIGRLLGKGGRTKQLIERTAGVKLEVQECLVTVVGKDGFKVMKASEVVRAIGEGFPVKKAFDLFKENHQLEVYDIEQVVPNRAALERQISRIIGEKGKTKKYFEGVLSLKIHVTDEKVWPSDPGIN